MCGCRKKKKMEKRVNASAWANFCNETSVFLILGSGFVRKPNPGRKAMATVLGHRPVSGTG